MAGRAVLSRMETICAEVMEIPEILLAEEDDDESVENCDDDDDAAAAAELDELAADEDDAETSVEDCDGEKSGEGSSKSSGGKGEKSGKEKGVSVKVNCEDKKQEKYGKWISRAFKAAVNPIVSKFNLNLKVNLDLNVENKEGKKNSDDSGSVPKPGPEGGKVKPTGQQLKRRADLARIRELEKENRHLEKVFEKIVTAYTDMKVNLAEKSSEYDKLKEKHSQEESKIGKLVDELLILKKSITNLESDNKKLQSDKLMLSRDLKQEKDDKVQQIKHFESKMEEIQRQSQSELQKLRDETDKKLLENQATLTAKEVEINKLSTRLETLQEDFARAEASNLQNSQQYLQRQVLRIFEEFTCPLCEAAFQNTADQQLHVDSCFGELK